MSSWSIHKRGEVCQSCERAFDEEEVHYSLLFVGAAVLERRERCRRCFEKGNEEEQGSAAPLSWWRTRRTAEGRRGLALDFQAVERLFHALAEREEENLPELRYLLALLLMRKRRLKLLRVKRTADGERLLMRRPRRKEEIPVDVFELSPERIGALRAELERVFEGSFEEAVPGPEVAPTTDEA